jgi:hypothetical protein
VVRIHSPRPIPSHNNLQASEQGDKMPNLGGQRPADPGLAHPYFDVSNHFIKLGVFTGDAAIRRCELVGNFGGRICWATHRRPPAHPKP